MIIRSQDKKVLVSMSDMTIKTCGGENCIIAYGNNQSHDEAELLGIYSTEEKAIKVLDMICKEYKNSNNSTSLGHYGFVENRVFQMPQDSEV